FEEEQTIGHQQLRQRHRRGRTQVLVDVVGELNAKSKLLPQVGEHLDDVLDVYFVVEDLGLRPGVARAVGLLDVDEATSAVGSKLATDDRVSLFEVSAHV